MSIDWCVKLLRFLGSPPNPNPDPTRIKSHLYLVASASDQILKTFFKARIPNIRATMQAIRCQLPSGRGSGLTAPTRQSQRARTAVAAARALDNSENSCRRRSASQEWNKQMKFTSLRPPSCGHQAPRFCRVVCDVLHRNIFEYSMAF